MLYNVVNVINDVKATVLRRTSNHCLKDHSVQVHLCTLVDFPRKRELSEHRTVNQDIIAHWQKCVLLCDEWYEQQQSNIRVYSCM
jgi:hypothetical protein